MGNRSADKIKFTSFDELFGEPVSEKVTEDQIIQLPLNVLRPFQNHPFHVTDNEEMMELAESVRQHGVLVPILVRRNGDGGYEIVAGHRRKRACELAGYRDIPAVVRELSDDESIIAMVDSNIQRQNILPSEKARAYRMKMEALEHQGVKNGQHTAVLLGEASGESARTVHRYIRLTYLVPGLLEYVDQKKIPVVAGESLSFLRTEEQKLVNRYIAENQIFPSKSEAESLRAESSREELTANCIGELLCRKEKTTGITISAKRVREYFPPNYTREQIEGILFRLLDSWKENELTERG